MLWDILVVITMHRTVFNDKLIYNLKFCVYFFKRTIFANVAMFSCLILTMYILVSQIMVVIR